MTVDDTQTPGATLYVHVGEVERASSRSATRVELAVDDERRDASARNHSATHLLH